MTERAVKKKAQLGNDAKPEATLATRGDSALGAGKSITAALNAKPFIPAALASALPSAGAACWRASKLLVCLACSCEPPLLPHPGCCGLPVYVLQQRALHAYTLLDILPCAGGSKRGDASHLLRRRERSGAPEWETAQARLPCGSPMRMQRPLSRRAPAAAACRGLRQCRPRRCRLCQSSRRTRHRVRSALPSPHSTLRVSRQHSRCRAPSSLHYAKAATEVPVQSVCSVWSVERMPCVCSSPPPTPRRPKTGRRTGGLLPRVRAPLPVATAKSPVCYQEPANSPTAAQSNLW